MCCGVDGASAGYSIEAMNDGKALAASGIIGALGDSLYTYSSAARLVSKHRGRARWTPACMVESLATPSSNQKCTTLSVRCALFPPSQVLLKYQSVLSELYDRLHFTQSHNECDSVKHTCVHGGRSRCTLNVCCASCAPSLHPSQVLPKYQSVLSELYDRLRVVSIDDLLPAVDKILMQLELKRAVAA